MLSLFPDWPAFSVFLIATLAVGAAPGPGMMFAVARSVGQGRLAGAVSVAGLSAGSFTLCLSAAFGVAAVIAASQLAYDVLRYLGAAYLIWLAVRTVVVGGAMPVGARSARRDPLRRVFRQAVVTNLLNPKSGLFYVSFVPQFTDPERGSVVVQFILLGVIFNLLGNSINLMVALFFGRIGDWLASHRQVWRGQQWFTASVFCAIAAHLVFAERR
jgi:threonine/homoserine/homoserine lactone efflux protein